MNFWLEVLAFAVGLTLYGRLIIWLYHQRDKRRQVKFLQFLAMKFPDATVTYRAVSGESENDAFLKLIASMQEREGDEL